MPNQTELIKTLDMTDHPDNSSEANPFTTPVSLSGDNVQRPRPVKTSNLVMILTLLIVPVTLVAFVLPFAIATRFFTAGPGTGISTLMLMSIGLGVAVFFCHVDRDTLSFFPSASTGRNDRTFV